MFKNSYLASIFEEKQNIYIIIQNISQILIG